MWNSAINFEHWVWRTGCVGVQYSRENIIFILFLPEIGYVKQHLPKIAKNVDGFLYIK
jgi:hypothetical protein